MGTSSRRAASWQWVDVGLLLVERILGGAVRAETARFILSDPAASKARYFPGLLLASPERLRHFCLKHLLQHRANQRLEKMGEASEGGSEGMASPEPHD
jgi:hypothetical protein